MRYTGPEWRAHAHNRRNATRACSQHAETHRGIHLHSNGVCARNMRHLKTLGRATNLSSIKIHHVERHTGREWRIHPHMHRNTPHAYLGPAQTANASLDPFALKTCSQHTAPPRARASLGRARATSRPSKFIMSSASPVLSGVLMHTPVGTLRTRALAMPQACREPFAVIWCSQWHLS